MNYKQVSITVFLIILLGGLLICEAQNKESIYVYKESHNQEFSTVVVDLEHYVDLTISTVKDKGSYVTDVKHSGEYKDALMLNADIKNDTLFISDPYNAGFEFPQDKLSAHKITDSKASLVLPDNINLFLHLVNSHIKISGNYKSTILNIKTGQASFSEMSGDIAVTSVDANIFAHDLKNHVFQASSRNGKVKMPEHKREFKYRMKVESIHGDIKLN